MYCIARQIGCLRDRAGAGKLGASHHDGDRRRAPGPGWQDGAGSQNWRTDRSRLRTGNATQILAALRNFAITLIHRFGSSHIRATRRHFASCPQEALALLGFPNAGQQ